MTEKNDKPKRVLNRWAIALIVVILLVVISIFKIPSFKKERALTKLGYSEEAITAIKKTHLTKTIIENDYYSDYLNQEIVKEDFKKERYKLYLYRPTLTEDDFLLYDKLIAKGYTNDEVDNLYKELKFYELTPLLVFDKIVDLDSYINDCKQNADNNSLAAFKLSKNYLYPYQNVKDAKNIGTETVLVSLKNELKDYKPSKLVPLGYQYASEGVEIDNMAYEAFIALWQEMMDKDLPIYALNGYRSYEDQAKIYNSYDNPKEADAQSIRPGFGESQTGLDLTVVDTRNEKLSNFGNTEEYKYLKENAHRFGFIIRYPENKSSITGYEFIPYQIRYVGKELAGKIYKSGLTYEEYFYLYLDSPVNEPTDKQ